MYGRLLWSVRIDTDPQPQQRPRFSARCNGVYDPCSKYKSDILKQIQSALPGKPFESASGFHMRVDFAFKRPKSHRTSRGLLTKKAPRFHTQRPDVDNLYKLYSDTISGHVYADDSSIVSIECRKGWLEDQSTETGSVTIQVYEAQPHPQTQP